MAYLLRHHDRIILILMVDVCIGSNMSCELRARRKQNAKQFCGLDLKSALSSVSLPLSPLLIGAQCFTCRLRIHSNVGCAMPFSEAILSTLPQIQSHTLRCDGLSFRPYFRPQPCVHSVFSRPYVLQLYSCSYNCDSRWLAQNA